MKLGLTLFFVGIAALAYPMLNEDATSECHALEIRFAFMSENPLFTLIAGNVSGGEFGKYFAKKKYPYAPPQAGCALLYWDSLLDESHFEQILQTSNTRS